MFLNRELFNLIIASFRGRLSCWLGIIPINFNLFRRLHRIIKISRIFRLFATLTLWVFANTPKLIQSFLKFLLLISLHFKLVSKWGQILVHFQEFFAYFFIFGLVYFRLNIQLAPNLILIIFTLSDFGTQLLIYRLVLLSIHLKKLLKLIKFLVKECLWFNALSMLLKPLTMLP